MPAPNVTDPTSMRSRARDWLRQNPGQHPPKAIAEGLGIPVGEDRRRFTNELARMARQGELIRSRPEGSAAMGPGSVYSLPAES